MLGLAGSISDYDENIGIIERMLPRDYKIKSIFNSNPTLCISV